MRIGLSTPVWGGGTDLERLLAGFQRADELGFVHAWMNDTGTSFDALTFLALAGRQTRGIELGSFVVPTYPRHPSALAHQALTTQVACGGRLTLGIGLSHRIVIESRLGLDFSHPVRHMHEYLQCLNGLLAGEALTFDGEEFHLNGYQVSVPGATPPPVLVAALGPQMLRLAGRLSSGTAIWMGGPRYLAEHVVPILDQAAAEAGRPAPRVLLSVPVCVTDRTEAVRERANSVFGRYGQLPSYRAVLDKEGVANPADVSLIGSEAELRQKLGVLAAAGATDFAASIFTPRGENAERTWAFLRDYAGRG